MGNARSFDKYSGNWLWLFEKFAEDPTKERLIPCATRKAAEKVRLEWYKARDAALHKTNDPEFTKNFEHILLSREVTLDGNTVKFMHKDYTPIGVVLREAIERWEEEENGSDDGQSS